jgi:hypothetical protein
MPTPAEIWATQFAARYEAEVAEEAIRREIAFLDAPVSLCGEQVRQLTPADLLTLHHLRNPFVRGGDSIRPGHVAQLLWLLSVENRPGLGLWWRRRKFCKRIGKLDAAATYRDVEDFIDAMFLDAPQGVKSEGKPPGVCFLASLAVTLATELGWTDQHIFSRPIPALFQYLKELKRRGDDKPDYSPSDRLKSEFLAILNKPQAEAA